jgi:hypothetical protein
MLPGSMFFAKLLVLYAIIMAINPKTNAQIAKRLCAIFTNTGLMTLRMLAEQSAEVPDNIESTKNIAETRPERNKKQKNKKLNYECAIKHEIFTHFGMPYMKNSFTRL